MSPIGNTLQLQAGSELRSAPLAMTRERMRWYVDAQPTVAADDGRIHTQPPTIHDDDYAKKQGLPGIIADGMISTNWIMGLLLDAFGRDALRKGKLRTKYIAPIYENEIDRRRARARARMGRTARRPCISTSGAKPDPAGKSPSATRSSTPAAADAGMRETSRPAWPPPGPSAHDGE